MSKPRYRRRSKGFVKIKDPQGVGEELERLAHEYNGTRDFSTLAPGHVVEGARQVESPLHEYFEWSERKAAHAYRVDQARNLIRSIEIVPARGKRGVARWENVTVTGGDDEPRAERRYVHHEVAKRDANLRKQVSDSLARQLGVVIRRAEDFDLGKHSAAWRKIIACFNEGQF